MLNPAKEGHEFISHEKGRRFFVSFVPSRQIFSSFSVQGAAIQRARGQHERSPAPVQPAGIAGPGSANILPVADQVGPEKTIGSNPKQPIRSG